eukprot:Platyproteum_vivax@DN6809_c0_g1_i2.p1
MALAADTEEIQEEVEQEEVDLWLLAKSGNFSDIFPMIEANNSLIHEKDSDGQTFLHWASLAGNVETVERLVGLGAVSDAPSSNGQTPLMWSAIRGHVKVAKYLISQGAKLSSTDSVGVTPFMLAVQHRQIGVLLLMHKLGADVQHVDINGCTAAHWAAYIGQTSFLRFLLYFGCNLNALDKTGRTALHRSVMGSQFTTAMWLVTYGLDPLVKDNQKKSAVDYLQENNHNYFAAAIQRKFNDIQFDMQWSNNTQGSIKELEAGTKSLHQLVLESNTAGPNTSKIAPNLRVESLIALFFDCKESLGLKAGPYFWLMCMALTYWLFCGEIRSYGYEVVPLFTTGVDVGFIATLLVYIWLAASDPGEVRPPPYGNTGIEFIEDKLANSDDPASVQDQLNRLCHTCLHIKELRTKHCSTINVCVEGFDHYCAWVHNDIGAKNHRLFVVWLFLHFITQFFWFGVHVAFYYNIVRLGESWSQFPIFFLVEGVPSIFIWLLNIGVFIWLGCLIYGQLQSISANYTTNEFMNLHRYKHFWTEIGDESAPRKQLINPFSKQTTWENCLQFWWEGRSSTVEAQPFVYKPRACGGCKDGSCHSHNTTQKKVAVENSV